MDEEKNNFHGIVLIFSIIFLMILLIMDSYVSSTYIGSVLFDVSIINATKKEPVRIEVNNHFVSNSPIPITLGYVYYIKDPNDDVIAKADIDYRNSSAFSGGYKQIRIKWSKEGLKSVSKDTLKAVYNFKDLSPLPSTPKELATGIFALTDRYKIYDIQADAHINNSILGKIFSSGPNNGSIWVAFPRSKEELEQRYPINAKLLCSNITPANTLFAVSVKSSSHFSIVKYEWSKDGLVSIADDDASAIYLFKTTGLKTISVTLYNEVGIKKTLTATINVVNKDKK